MSLWMVLPLIAMIGGIVALALLGSQVIRRGVVFLDLAVAQAAAAAVILMDAVWHHDSVWVDQALATLGALAVVGVVAQITRRWAAQREALIGLLYVAGATLSLLSASLHPHGRDKLLGLLAADVLWVDVAQASMLIACALLVALLSRGDRPALARDAVFYACFAVVASIAVPALGVFLVFACLISPALWMERGLSAQRAIPFTVVAATLGLVLSWVFDLPSGPLVALAITALGLGCMASSARAPGG